MKKYFISMVCVLLAGSLSTAAEGAANSIQTHRKTVVIDPGHGGTSLGCLTQSGLREKDVTLRFARFTAELLEADFRILLTRTDDITLSLDERTGAANEAHADLFVSLHAKPVSALNPAPTLYVFKPLEAPGQDAPERWDTAQTTLVPESGRAAGIVCRAMSSGRPGDCILEAPMAVLSGAVMPAILVEAFSMKEFQTDAEAWDGLLRDHARKLAAGIREYLGPP